MKKKKIVYIPRRQSGTCTVPYMRWMPTILHQRVALSPLSNFSNFLCVTTIRCGCPGLSRAVYTHFFDIQRQSGTCSGIEYPLYTHITVCACTYMFNLEFQLVIPYHNRHMHCPRLSPSVMSHLGMVYIQHGTVRDSHT